VNASKAAIEDQFVDLLTELQPSPGVHGLVKDHVLTAWRTIQGEARSASASAQRRTKTIQQRLDRLDDAFLFAQTIDQETYTPDRNKLREELALARMDQHAAVVEEIDVEGILVRRGSAAGRRTCGHPQASPNVSGYNRSSCPRE
jgi:hypothetical protein